jgi:hypothetical protein
MRPPSRGAAVERQPHRKKSDDAARRGRLAHSGFGRRSTVRRRVYVGLTASGEKAIEFLRDDKNAFRAVVTDINLLEKLDGREVGRTAREIDPIMPIIYMTGTLLRNGCPRASPTVLTKLFAPAQILTAISQLLKANPPGPANSAIPHGEKTQDLHVVRLLRPGDRHFHESSPGSMGPRQQPLPSMRRPVWQDGP